MCERRRRLPDERQWGRDGGRRTASVPSRTRSSRRFPHGIPAGSLGLPCPPCDPQPVVRRGRGAKSRARVVRGLRIRPPLRTWPRPPPGHAWGSPRGRAGGVEPCGSWPAADRRIHEAVNGLLQAPLARWSTAPRWAESRSAPERLCEAGRGIQAAARGRVGPHDAGARALFDVGRAAPSTSTNIAGRRFDARRAAGEPDQAAQGCRRYSRRSIALPVVPAAAARGPGAASTAKRGP